MGISFLNKKQDIIAQTYQNKVLDISYKNNEISFDFTAIDYTFSDRITFQYKLEGYDKKWIFAGTKRSATYTNLDGGDYVFKEKACNSSLLWNEDPAQFKIHIIPPFWKTGWFIISVSLLLIILVYIGVRFRINSIRKEEKMNTAFNKKIAELESKALRSQMNPHFIFNSLNSIQSYIQRNDKENSSRYLSKFAKLTRLILDHSEHQFISIENEITALKIYLELEQFRFINKFDFEIIIDENIDMINTEIPPLIFQPYVENAIWHGIMHKEEGKGMIKIALSLENNFLKAIISDNGIGRKKAAAYKSKNITNHKSTAMRVTNDRLEILNKKNDLSVLTKIIDLENENGASTGTLVEILIPLHT